MIYTINSSFINERYLDNVVNVLNKDGIVIYPTDTLYGIGCKISSLKGLKKLFNIKRQRKEKPFSFICDSIKTAANYAIINDFAFKIMNELTPGPYTFVLPSAKNTPRLLKSSENTVGIRIPDSIWPLEIVKALGEPIVSTSLKIPNFFEEQDMGSIIKYYEFLADIILADYEFDFQNYQPSTVVDLRNDEIKILRQGKGVIDI